MGESKASGISEIDALRATISVVEQQRENYRQDAKEARAQVSALKAEVETKDRLLALRTRQNTQSSEGWAKAAEQALAGDVRALHDRVTSWRDPSRLTTQVVQSCQPEPSR